MRSAMIILIFTQYWCILGWPLFMENIKLAVDSALKASVGEVNDKSTSFNMYKATDRAISQVRLVDFNTYDLILNFAIRETMCLKPHMLTLDGCPFRAGMSEVESRCSSYVRVSAGLISLQGVTCRLQAISSSSEEIFQWLCYGILRSLPDLLCFGKWLQILNVVGQYAKSAIFFPLQFALDNAVPK